MIMVAGEILGGREVRVTEDLLATLVTKVGLGTEVQLVSTGLEETGDVQVPEAVRDPGVIREVRVSMVRVDLMALMESRENMDLLDFLERKAALENGAGKDPEENQVNEENLV